MEDVKNLIELYNKIKPIFMMSNNPDSNFPRKRDETDCSFPISIVSRPDNRLDDQLQTVNDFNTEMSFRPPNGYYIEIYGTDELLNKGYSLLQTKIIQPRNTSSIKVKLYKFADSEDLNLPFHSGLMAVLRNCNYSHLKRHKIESCVDEREVHSISNKYESTRSKNFFE